MGGCVGEWVSGGAEVAQKALLVSIPNFMYSRDFIREYYLRFL